MPVATVGTKEKPLRLIEATTWFWDLVDNAIEQENVKASEEEM